MPTPQCPICDADSAAYTDKDGYSLYRCGNCALIFLHPVPSTDELGHLYEEDWAVKNRWCENEGRAFVPKRHYFRALRWRRKAKRMRRLSGGTRLLEIGCGSGDYLAAAARAGFTDVFGIEPSVREAEHARARGFEVADSIFEDVDFGDRKFDAIVARHVIEHVNDPVQVLVRARDLLAPNGHIYIETPCNTHRRAVKWGLGWYSLCPPWHIHIFSKRSFELLFRRAGLTPIEVHDHFWRPDMTGIAHAP